MDVSGRHHASAVLPTVKNPCLTRRIGSWVGPKTGLHAVGKEINLSGIELRFIGRQARSLISVLTELTCLLARCMYMVSFSCGQSFRLYCQALKII